MKTNNWVIASFLLLFWVACQSQVGEIQRIDKAFVKTKLLEGDVQLVDVRTPQEYDAGTIGNAVNYNIIDGAQFVKQIETLDKSKPVYLFCKMGGRSNRAAQLMLEKGFTQVFDYAGGYNDWAKK